MEVNMVDSHSPGIRVPYKLYSINIKHPYVALPKREISSLIFSTILQMSMMLGVLNYFESPRLVL